MSRPFLSAVLCLLLAACDTEPVARNDVIDCDVKDPPTGSLVVRRERCVVTTEESREQARRQVEAIREEASRRQAAKATAAGGQ